MYWWHNCKFQYLYKYIFPNLSFRSTNWRLVTVDVSVRFLDFSSSRITWSGFRPLHLRSILHLANPTTTDDRGQPFLRQHIVSCMIACKDQRWFPRQQFKPKELRRLKLAHGSSLNWWREIELNLIDSAPNWLRLRGLYWLQKSRSTLFRNLTCYRQCNERNLALRASIWHPCSAAIGMRYAYTHWRFLDLNHHSGLVIVDHLSIHWYHESTQCNLWENTNDTSYHLEDFLKISHGKRHIGSSRAYNFDSEMTFQSDFLLYLCSLLDT